MEICILGVAHQSNKTVDSLAMETSKESSSPNEWLLLKNTVSSKLLVVATIPWPLLKRTNCLALAVMSRASVVSKKLRIWIDLWRSELWALANLLILSPSCHNKRVIDRNAKNVVACASLSLYFRAFCKPTSQTRVPRDQGNLQPNLPNDATRKL